jgi:hypothetical protein
MNEETETVVESKQQFVAWQGHRFNFEAREMTPRDWKVSGAEGDDLQTVEWNAANNWRVPREEIPLSDVEMGAWMSSNNFRLVEG